MINIDELTVGQVKEISKLCGNEKTERHPYIIGKQYLIRTVTHYYSGKLKSIYKNELVLESAAWVADTGRYYDALKNGTLNEVEPIIGDAIISRGAIVDSVEWGSPLILVQK